MIISVLKILDSGKIASQMISAGYHKVLVTTRELETRTSSLYQKPKYQVEEILHMPIQYVTISPAKMTPIVSY